MVPVIEPSRELSDVLNYNENKVQQGVSEFLGAGNFLKPDGELNYYDKFYTLENLNKLRERVQVNTWHVSLNFHPDDKLSKEKLIEIADLYMDRIGFGNQPYLVYQHFDAGHPHLHIVSTLIRPNGKRIYTHNIGKIQSVQARKEIDTRYGLRRVEDSQRAQQWEPTPINAQKLAYGKVPTKKAIKDVLRYVLAKYKFTSLPQLNAVLQQYNVVADRGTPGSRIYKNNGLVYRVLEEGKMKGVPIKASDFHFQPTLTNLGEKFEKNRTLRKADIPSVRGRIDWTLAKNPKTLEQWLNELSKEKIQAVLRHNDQGIVYGLTFVDFKTHTVLNGSDLGKAYSANAIMQRFGGPGRHATAGKTISSGKIPAKGRSAKRTTKPARPTRTTKHPSAQRKGAKTPAPASEISKIHPVIPLVSGGGSPSHDLSTPRVDDQIPFELTTDRKKKKKKRLQQ